MNLKTDDSWLRWHVVKAIFAVAILACGCSHDAPMPAAKQPSAVPAAVRLLVVDDPALVNAVQGMAGDWKAESGSLLEISTISADVAAAAEKLDADAIIYPPELLGTLAELPIDSTAESRLANERSVGSRRLADAVGCAGIDVGWPAICRSVGRADFAPVLPPRYFGTSGKISSADVGGISDPCHGVKPATKFARDGRTARRWLGCADAFGPCGSVCSAP